MLKYLPFLVLLSLSVVYSRSASGSIYQALAPSDKRGNKQVHVPTINPPKESSIWNDLSFLYKIYQQCAKDNLTVCLKVKLLAGLEKAFKTSRELKVYQGIKFVKIDDIEEDNEVSSVVLNEKEIEAQLPRALEAKDSTLNQMILSRVLSFLQTFTLQVKFPDESSIHTAMVEEGRHKKGKKHHKGAMIMIPLLIGGTMIPIAYGALAMLAGKALIVSKLALVLASIVGIKKLLSNGSHKESQHEVVVSGGTHGSGWGRDFDLAAFNSYQPKNDEQKLM